MNATESTVTAAGTTLKPTVGTDQVLFVPRQRAASLVMRFGVVIALVLVLILAEGLYPGFFSGTNISNLLMENVPLGLVGLGMTVVMLGGGFDLSAGSIYTIGGVVYTQAASHMALVPAALIALGTGAVAGAVNGAIITRLRVNPFITTLGTGSAYAGLAFILTGSEPVSVTRSDFATMGNGAWFGIPICVYVFAALAIVAIAMMAKTKFGRSVYAVGGNAEASRLCGIHVERVKALTYVLCGTVSALGGMIIASRLSVIMPDIGSTATMSAIAIVVIGGTSLFGGEGAIWRTVVGLLIMGALSNVLNAKAVSANWQDVVTGAVVIGAVAMDVWVRRYGTRRRS